MIKYKSITPQFKLVKEKSLFELQKTKISTSNDAANFARNFYESDLEIYESFFLILLNRSNNTIGWVKISQGGIDATVVDVQLIAKYAVESLAKSVILVHNHPSGGLEPSDADRKVTRNCINTLKIFGCTVLDHIILTATSNYSFVDNGLLE